MLYIFEDFTRDQQVLDDLFQRPQPSNLIVELQSNLSASSFCSCRGKRSGKRLLHWLNEQACTVGVRNRTQKILRISLPLTNMSLISNWLLSHIHETRNLHPWNFESALTPVGLQFFSKQIQYVSRRSAQGFSPAQMVDPGVMTNKIVSKINCCDCNHVWRKSTTEHWMI